MRRRWEVVWDAGGRGEEGDALLAEAAEGIEGTQEELARVLGGR